MKHWILTLVAAGGLAFASLATAEDGPIDMTLPQLDGGEFKLADHRGDWVVLNYWATWCAPCRKEIPDLSELHTRRQDIIVAGLAYEELEPEDFSAFLEEFEVTYPILLVDVYAPPEPFGPPKVLPTTIIINPEGGVTKTIVGPVTGAEIEAVVDGP